MGIGGALQFRASHRQAPVAAGAVEPVHQHRRRRLTHDQTSAGICLRPAPASIARPTGRAARLAASSSAAGMALEAAGRGGAAGRPGRSGRPPARPGRAASAGRRGIDSASSTAARSAASRPARRPARRRRTGPAGVRAAPAPASLGGRGGRRGRSVAGWRARTRGVCRSGSWLGGRDAPGGVLVAAFEFQAQRGGLLHQRGRFGHALRLLAGIGQGQREGRGRRRTGARRGRRRTAWPGPWRAPAAGSRRPTTNPVWRAARPAPGAPGARHPAPRAAWGRPSALVRASVSAMSGLRRATARHTGSGRPARSRRRSRSSATPDASARRGSAPIAAWPATRMARPPASADRRVRAARRSRVPASAARSARARAAHVRPAAPRRAAAVRAASRPAPRCHRPRAGRGRWPSSMSPRIMGSSTLRTAAAWRAGRAGICSEDAITSSGCSTASQAGCA